MSRWRSEGRNRANVCGARMPQVMTLVAVATQGRQVLRKFVDHAFRCAVMSVQVGPGVAQGAARLDRLRLIVPA